MKKLFIPLFMLIASLSFGKDTMVLLCGVTMRYAVEEVTTLFSENHDVEFEISYGGSGNLKTLIQENKVGDLFFPGSDSYINQLKDTGEVNDTAAVGENRATLMVKKGNPKKISNINALTDWDYGVVLARAESGSIGREAEKILTDFGILDDAMDNALYLTTDSKDLGAAIRNGDADVTINWRAAATWPENKGQVDTIDIPGVSGKQLVFGRLSYSRHPQLAMEFLRFVASDTGRAIFEKHGF